MAERKSPPPPKEPPEDRETRLAAALRANLKRRKEAERPKAGPKKD